MLFTFPSQYLFTIGLSGVFSLGGWSPHIQTGFHVSRPTHLSLMYAFQVRGYHPLWLFFPEHSSKHIKAFGLIRFRSPLLTESLRFLFLRVLRCFSSPGLLSNKLEWLVFNQTGCPIRTSADQFVCADPRSFSQLTTSFFASESLGIRHTPLTISFLILLISSKHLKVLWFSLCDVFTVIVNDLICLLIPWYEVLFLAPLQLLNQFHI